MKILIIDDTAKNLEAAKIASKQRQFSKHEFVFADKATDAMRIIKENIVDAVVTDFLFFRESSFDAKSYEKYVLAYDKNAPNAILLADYPDRILYNRRILTDSDLAAYGGVIAITCKNLGIPFTIITDLHCHWFPDSSDTTRSADGIFLLSPLVGADILTVDDILNNSHKEYYQGYRGNVFPSKDNPECWIKGIKMVLSQPTKIMLQKGTSEERQKQIKRQEDFIRRQEKELAKKLDGIKISDDLKRQILPLADDKNLLIVNSDIAAILNEVSDYGSSGGVGYSSQVTVFYKNQRKEKAWQWRDRYSAANDCPWLRVNSLGTIEVSENKKGIVCVEVELIKNADTTRTTTFEFNPSETIKKTGILSIEEQLDFYIMASKEEGFIIDKLNSKQRYSPQKMLTSHPDAVLSYESYRKPSIKQSEICQEIGVAAFVIEEQIDHRGSDPQIRHNLYVLTAKNRQAKYIAEDHGYIREGGAFLKIHEVKHDYIVISTKDGKSTVKF